jgi:sulfide:quinone oxidoreductase
MTEHNNPIPGHVVIVGGGVAGLEALLALRALLGDRVEVTLISQHDLFVDRPVTVAEPFGLGSAARYSLPEIAADTGAEFIRGKVVAVDAEAHRVSLEESPDIAFDALILAPGARSTTPLPDAITFGVRGSDEAMAEMLSRMRAGAVRSVTFVAPSMTGWILPLYELALMTAGDLARHKVDGVHVSLVTSETRPLALFGDKGSDTVARLLEAAGIEFIGAAGGTHEVMVGVSAEARAADYLVTLPVLRGPAIDGVPATQDQGFIPVDEHGRVLGLANVYAAGDATDFPVKQGGLAAQQADSVAEHIAASYGADVDPQPFEPVLRGMLFTGGEPLYMRSGVPGADPDVPGAWYPLWWPPTKVAGRYLAPYLFERGEEDEFGGPPVGFIDVDVPLAAVTLPG